MLQRLECMWLVDHLRNGPNIFKVGAIYSYSVNAHRSNVEHSLFSLGFSLRSKQSRQHAYILTPGFYYCHRIITSLHLLTHYIVVSGDVILLQTALSCKQGSFFSKMLS